MISQEYPTSTLFNPIAFQEPFFDRVSGEDYSLQTTTTTTTSSHSLSSKDMYQSQDAFPTADSTFPPHYPAFRRMSADTQTSSADSASPDHKPNDKMASLVLPPIHDLPRPLSPQTSDASSTRSPQWQHQQQQHAQSAQLAPQHYAPPPPPPGAYNFPPIDQHRARPQLHINPPDYRTQNTSYPTPTTANGHHTAGPGGHSHTASSGGASSHSSSAYSSSSTYTPYNSLRRPEDHYRQVPPPPPGPPVVTPATLATAVGLQQRRRGKLPKPVTEFLKKWLLAHTDHPYPTEDEKKWLCSETGLSMSQVSNWMINARRRILAPAAKANAAAAAAAAASANAAVTSSATATAATPYYSTRSPPVRTVSGSTSSSSEYATNGSHYRRDSSYAPYPMPASRVTNAHPQPHQQQQQQQQHHHQYSSPATSYPSSAPPYSAASAYHHHFQSPTPVPAGHAQGPTSAPPLPPALAPYASSTLAPFGDSHEPNGTERTKSPGGDFAYAPQ